MAQAIYKSWFVDFEPFQEEEFIESELGMIPEGWEVGHLGDKKLTKLVRGSIDKFEGEKIYLATADVNNFKIESYETKITYKEKPSRANRKPEPNTIWFAKMKDSKKIILVSEFNDFLINNIILSTGFMGLEVKENALYYVWNFISEKDFEKRKDKLCTGTTMEAINMTNTKKINILVPPNNILTEFNDLMEPIYKKISNKKNENQTLKELRDSLLPKLMSGEIRVPLDEDAKEVN
jgi:type I restriction enzyme S subunit